MRGSVHPRDELLRVGIRPDSYDNALTVVGTAVTGTCSCSIVSAAIRTRAETGGERWVAILVSVGLGGDVHDREAAPVRQQQQELRQTVHLLHVGLKAQPVQCQ